MPILLTDKEMKRLEGRKVRARRMKPVKAPAKARRDMERKLRQLWQRIITPATQELVDMIKRGASPLDVAEFIERTLRVVEFDYNVSADDIAWKWHSAVDEATKAKMQASLSQSLGIDITAVLNDPKTAEALAMGNKTAVSLIKTIPQDYFEDISRAVMDNFSGVGLPEGRTLSQQINQIHKVGRKKAEFIAKDQTQKLTGILNQFRQEDIGIEEYIWRTMADNRVVGNPSGIYPKGNAKHMNHYARNGKKFRWDSPPPDGHPGTPIGDRCYSEAVIDVKKILAHARTV